MKSSFKQNDFLLSLVFPCFNESDNLEPLLKAVNEELKDFRLELLFIDDGSSDGTRGKLVALSRQDPRIKFASFSRNFGHQLAVKCGLDLAEGDCCVVLDADLQHPLRVVKELIAQWREGYRVVRTVRADSESESLFKRMSSRCFYRLLQAMGMRGIKPGMADFYLLDRQVVDLLKYEFKETEPFLRGMLSWIGFSVAEVTYHPDERLHGKSKYSLMKMIRLASNGITSFSTLPLKLSAYVGMIFLVLCGLYVLYVLYVHFTGGTVQGWSSLMIVTLICNGVTLVSLGVLGQYIGLSFLETKGRPAYIVERTNITPNVVTADPPALAGEK